MKHLFFLVVFIISTLIAGFSSAQEAPYRLDDIIVTAERMATPLGEAPANVSIITKEDIEISGARTIIDIFEQEPGVITSNLLGSPKKAQIDIRGYGEAAPQNVLFLVDGRRINSIDLSGADLSQIPLDMIERVEIYRGPASVLYGDNAAAGVVNIIMKKGEGKPRFQVGVTAGSYNFFKPQVSVSGQEGIISYFALATALDTTGYRHNNDLNAKDLLGNFIFDPSGNLSFAVKAGHHKDRYGLPGPLYVSALREGTVDRKDSNYPFDNASTEDNFVDAEAIVKIGSIAQFSVGGSYRIRHNNSFFYFTGGGFTENRQELNTTSLTPKLIIDTPIWGRPNTFTAGWDYYKYPTTITVNGKSSLGPSYTTTDVDRTDNALYVNERFYPMDDLLVEAGYRVQKVGYKVDHSDGINPLLSLSSDTHQKKEAYRFSANYLLGKKGDVFISYAQGFRFPVTDEFVIPGYCFFGICQPTQVNSSLNAQITDEIDAGFRFNHTNYLGGSFTFFQAKNKNEIYFNPILFANMNYEKTKRTGVESALFFKPVDPLLVTVNYSYVKAVFDGGPFDGNDVPLVPNSKLGVKLSYTIIDNLTFNLMSVSRSNCYVVSDQENKQQKLPGFTTFDASLSWASKKIMAVLAIKNITGKKYSEYAVYSPFANDTALYPSPRQQALLSVQYAFGE
jgi:iron complex outermembrane receptor protein